MKRNHRKRRIWKWSVAVLLLAVTVELVLRLMPSHVESVDYCTRCGLFREVDSAREPPDDVRYQPRRMSRWYEENVGIPHEHHWKMVWRHHTTRGLLWERVSLWHNWDDEPAREDGGEDGVYFVERLRRHDLLEEYFRLLTSDDRDTRLSAWEARESLSEFEPDKVADWWSALQRVIQDNAADADKARQEAEDDRGGLEEAMHSAAKKGRLTIVR